MRTPSLAIVWATLAISSGVASTSPWPIAETARSTSSPISVGIVDSAGSTSFTIEGA